MPVQALNKFERETIVNASDGDDVVRIWTAQRKVITRLRKDGAFTETRTGFYGSTEWAEFVVPADQWSPAGVKRTRKLSDTARRAAAERMARARAARTADQSA